ncbi:MAG: YqgE/AlgH family protein [Deltaproteobacteria bacterium]|nr:YqgE/AlgH family protein [Deltaproteobacteria bacterium]
MNPENKSIIDTLTGSFLISTPRMPDPRFSEQVLYICVHSHEGTMALVINRPNLFLTMDEILRGANLPVPESILPPVYSGGPVEPASACILFSSDYQAEQQLAISATISLSRDVRLLEDIARGQGPEKYLFILGYAGWGPGQLEQELVAEGWLVVPADDALVFDVPDEEKWQRAALLYGIDIATYGDMIGNA